MQIIQLVKRLERQLKFAAVGLTSLLFGTVSLIFFVEVVHLSNTIAYAIQTVVAVEVNFILNCTITWRDRTQGKFWRSWWRYHLSRVFTIIFNQILFNSLVYIHTPYLLAFSVCIVVSLFINYTIGEKLVFKQHNNADHREDLPTVAVTDQTRRITLQHPDVSIVVPVKKSERTIRELVVSLLEQDYPGNVEIILVGDYDDSTWVPLADLVHDPRLRIIEANITSPARDANAKRNIGLAAAKGNILGLTDSDMKFTDQHWISLGVERIQSGYAAVAGSMISESNGFWGQYVDQNPYGGKTPRMQESYILTEDNYAKGKHKPPVTAAFFCTKEVYEIVGGLDANFTRSYEDYEWFKRIVNAGYSILCDDKLAGHHYHREGFRSLTREYLKSGWGCADYIVTHPTCRLTRKRMIQWPLVQLSGLIMIVAVTIHPIDSVALSAVIPLILGGLSLYRVRQLEAFLYPVITLILGVSFSLGITQRFVRQGWRKPHGIYVHNSAPRAV